MSKKASPKLIGGFVVGAVVLLVVGVMIFGSGKFFAERQHYVLFFSGSVKGLNVGAPVTLKGVRIGAVTKVKALFHPEPIAFYTPVYVEVIQGTVATVPGNKVHIDLKDPDREEKTMDLLVKKGLRARLEMQSLVTGQLQVSFDLYPDSPVNLTGMEKDKKIMELPTLPSELQQLAETLQDIDFKGIAEDIQNAVAGVEELVNSPELAEAITNLNKTLEDFGKLARNVDSRVGPLATSIEGTMKDAGELIRNVDAQVDPVLRTAQSALEQAENTLAAIEDMTGRNSALRNKVEETLTAVRGAARSMRVLADYLERNPDALLFGKGEPGGQ